MYICINIFKGEGRGRSYIVTQFRPDDCHIQSYSFESRPLTISLSLSLTSMPSIQTPAHIVVPLAVFSLGLLPTLTAYVRRKDQHLDSARVAQLAELLKLGVTLAVLCVHRVCGMRAGRGPSVTDVSAPTGATSNCGCYANFVHLHCHIHTHTHTHIHTHANTHVNMQTCTYIHTFIHHCTLTRSHTHQGVLACIGGPLVRHYKQPWYPGTP